MTRAASDSLTTLNVHKDFSRFLTDLNASPYPAKHDLVPTEWWKALEGVNLMLKSQKQDKPKSVPAKWVRAGKQVAMLGRGLLKDESAIKLSMGHWLEAIDATHRYGHNLHAYFELWKKSTTAEHFFYWLDHGEGKDADLPECPRSKLEAELITYLAPKERKQYEVVIHDGKLMYKQNKEFLNTEDGDKYIFVLSTSGKLYVGQKEKGKFQHSSFLAGGSATSAGRISVKDGVLELAEPHSGHYRPTEHNFNVFVKVLTECGVDFKVAKIEALSHEESRARYKLKKSLLREESSNLATSQT